MTQENKGLWLGLLGVVMFAATLPMTKLALGGFTGGLQTDVAPGLSAWFVTFGRAAVAGLCSVVYLLAIKSSVPERKHWRMIGFTALGVIVGFPLLMALALQSVPSTHGAVVTGLMPLATAIIGALWWRQKPSLGYWMCAVLGSVLVLCFMALRSYQVDGRVALHWADVFLIGAMLIGATGYIGGAHLTPFLGAERVICWVLVFSLPVTIPVALWNMPTHTVTLAHWLGFAYVALFSMWIGFFAWYRGLHMGGVVRVSQVQLLQPFLSILFAVPLVGEHMDLLTVGFALAVIATVFVGKRMPVNNTPSTARQVSGKIGSRRDC